MATPARAEAAAMRPVVFINSRRVERLLDVFIKSYDPDVGAEMSIQEIGDRK